MFVKKRVNRSKKQVLLNGKTALPSKATSSDQLNRFHHTKKRNSRANLRAFAHTWLTTLSEKMLPTEISQIG